MDIWLFSVRHVSEFLDLLRQQMEVIHFSGLKRQPPLKLFVLCALSGGDVYRSLILHLGRTVAHHSQGGQRTLLKSLHIYMFNLYHVPMQTNGIFQLLEIFNRCRNEELRFPVQVGQGKRRLSDVQLCHDQPTQDPRPCRLQSSYGMATFQVCLGRGPLGSFW